MDTNKIKQAIVFAKQNPDSTYATELRKRIESGALDKELHSAGLSQYATAPKQESIVKSIVVDPFRTLIEKPATSLGKVAALGVAEGADLLGKDNLAERIRTEALKKETPSIIGGKDVSTATTGGEIVGDTLKTASYLFPYGKVAGAIGGVAGKTTGNIASGALGGYLSDVGTNLSDSDRSVSESLTPGLGTALGAVIPATGAAIKGAKNVKAKISPVKSVDETIGKIIQGETSDIPLAKKALSAIDTKNIKTRAELSTALQTAKEDLMKVVDAELAKDTRVLPIDNYAIRATNEAGKTVKTNVVRNAFNDLKELFSSTADDLSLSNLQLLEQKALNEGLTHQEVNNIARMYSKEFGTKAFNKLGDPLTSVNAQRFQNTRNGLKEAARGGLGFGEEAAQADRLYSAVSNTQRLIDKGVEGVNKLQQRVKERGILEKLSRNAINTLNTLSGGSLKGAASAVFPSNVGLKTLNWLDLENQLAKDLELINKANTVKTDSGLIKLLNTMKFPGDSAVDDISKRIDDFNKLPSKVKQGGYLNIGGGNDKLIQEAKKYKSANEFVKAQGTPVYHGTKSNIGIKDITAQPESRGQYLGNGIYFTKFKEGADLYGGKTIDAIVNEKDFLNISNLKGVDRTNKIGSFGTYKQYLKNSNLEDTEINFKKWQKNQQEVADKILNTGYKGVTDGQQHVIFDKSALKTKSQLTDIWNKANTGSKVDPLIVEAKKYKSAEEFVKAKIPEQLSYLEKQATGVSYETFKRNLVKNIGSVERGEKISDDVAQSVFERLQKTAQRGEFSDEATLFRDMGGRNPKRLLGDETITVYRATPVNKLRAGDFVSPDKSEAGFYTSETKKIYPFKIKKNELVSVEGSMGGGQELIYIPKGSKQGTAIEFFKSPKEFYDTINSKSQLEEIWKKANQQKLAK